MDIILIVRFIKFDNNFIFNFKYKIENNRIKIPNRKPMSKHLTRSIIKKLEGN